jgi:hypothetical protein
MLTHEQEGIVDRPVKEALDLIVAYAVKMHEDGTTHHVHLRSFEDYTREQRIEAAHLLLWLAKDIVQVPPFSEDSDDLKAWDDMLEEAA